MIVHNSEMRQIFRKVRYVAWIMTSGIWRIKELIWQNERPVKTCFIITFQTHLVVPFLFSFPSGTSHRRVWKERTLTGDTASPLSTTTTCSWLVFLSCCSPLYCICWGFAASIAVWRSPTLPPLCRGWKRASAHPLSQSTSELWAAWTGL